MREGDLPATTFDVAVVGAGVVGSAIARQLARRGATVVLVEAGCDVGTGTSKANTAILHTGFDTKPGTLESRLVPHGYALLRDYAGEARIPLAVPGALVVAWSEQEASALSAVEVMAEENGYGSARS